MTAACHACGRELPADRFPVRATCACGAWLHCCRNCAFNEPGRANDCREPNAERVADKEGGNFCDWFRPGVTQAAPAATAARARLDALFAKKPS